MSMVEEDVELRDLLAQTLEKNGCLAKLRAELRANVFLALDEDEKLSKQQPFQNHKVRSYLQTAEGRTIFCLVHEFLEFFNLQYTLSVFEPESYLDSVGQYEGRKKLADNLGLNSENEQVPLLQQLFKIAQTKLDINLNVDNESLRNESAIDSSYKKTDETVYSSSNESQEKSKQFNATFDVNSPKLAFNNPTTENYLKIIEEEAPTVKNVPVPQLLNIIEDDTYEDTSSIAEDSEVQDVPFKNPSINKPKKSNNLSSLSDLPPLNLNKSKLNDLKNNMSNLKELDQMFDMETEYEEDFISEEQNNKADLDMLNLINNINDVNNSNVLNGSKKSEKCMDDKSVNCTQ
ncbi:unnamed protein product [Ceutorhynchus assimilis]|uniref:Centrosomal protein 43 n=1 Tax=Ceutorhynchus assimilis TaxID=467358 RepID=A0A9N9MPY6_9CUCU|nr:unnamed protein product [Ceutorhynchus assimilis]